MPGVWHAMLSALAITAPAYGSYLDAGRNFDLCARLYTEAAGVSLRLRWRDAIQ
jgi:hypothetical protein